MEDSLYTTKLQQTKCKEVCVYYRHARTVVYFCACSCDFLNVCNRLYTEVNTDYNVKYLMGYDGFYLSPSH